MPKRALLYAAAIFLSSSLLFLVEPMAGKRLLPLLGGSSAVWVTCLVFFQTALLLGYLCAHGIATRLRPRAQRVVYGFLLAASLAQVGLNLDPHPHASTLRPVFSVLTLLAALIGLPFLVLSATNPLVQAWYARGSVDGPDPKASPAPPYRLFALSNFASLLGLLAYPVLIEPNFSLRAQTLAWAVGFAAFVLVCGAMLARGDTVAAGEAKTRQATRVNAAAPNAAAPGIVAAQEMPRAVPAASRQGMPPAEAAASSPTPDTPPTVGERTLWLLMAGCGSLLLCAVTSHLSQNIAAIPLFWVIPLTIYLLTFVLAFNGGKIYWRWLMVRLLPLALGSAGYEIAKPTLEAPIWLSVPFFCVVLFIGCFFCHGELYRRRPSPRYTTQYYLLIAAGGALGSIFVGVLAPVMFRGNYEMAWSLVYTAALAGAILWREHVMARLFWPAASTALLVVVALQVLAEHEDAIVQVRSFYGTLRVTQKLTADGGMYRTLIHGTIQHGTQFFGSDELRHDPTTYYSRNSGIGLALENCCKGRTRRVAAIGLGTGTLAAYGETGDVFRFYEIDPRVETIAHNVFTYLRESQARIEIVEGDARLSMEAEPPQHYDMIAVDAFSGDAIPVHLLTAEAIRLYRRHLAPGGIIAIHISNQYLNLAPVVQEQADHAGMRATLISTADDEDTGAFASDWVLVTENQNFLALPDIAAGESIEPKPGLRLWTDDYSSLLPILRLREVKKQE
jgi:SAM-dependent methyltransferase